MRVLLTTLIAFFTLSLLYGQEKVTFEGKVEDSEVFKTIRHRRSIREFKDKEVSNATIKTLIRAAQWAPSSHNHQTWRFVAVRDQERRRKIARAAHKKSGTEGSLDEIKKYLGMDAPVQIFVFNDTSVSESPDSDAVGCYAATQNLLLAATDLGLGTCWQGWPLSAGEIIDDVLNVPESFEAVATVALGYPDADPDAPERKHELEEILWFEKYGKE